MALVRARPPEDYGGPLGYAELLKAINDPTQERHEELKRWVDGRGTGPFDPEKFDVDFINQTLQWTAQDLRRHAPSRQSMGHGNKFGNKTPPNTMKNRDTRRREMLEKPAT
jgi:hypothetical protein